MLDQETHMEACSKCRNLMSCTEGKDRWLCISCLKEEMGALSTVQLHGLLEEVTKVLFAKEVK